MNAAISADFDSGNIELLAQRDNRIDLAIRRDQGSDFYQWFYFRVDGAVGQSLELRITNAATSAYPLGWDGYRACVSTDDSTWLRADTAYADGILTIRHKLQAPQTWFAYFAPYTSERHAQLVARYAAHDNVEHRVLGKTLDGRDLDLLTLGSGKRNVWLYARQHPGETMAEWWMEGALECLTSGESLVQRLLAQATVRVVPNMNPDGSARGHLRTNAIGVNLNREWHAPSLERSPEVFHVLNEMASTGVDFALDVHGDEAIPYVFIAGIDGIPSLSAAQTAHCKLYVDALAARTPDFQTVHGYPPNAPGKANLTISTNQLAERFGAVAMTLEMPFKDHLDSPDFIRGWSPERSHQLGRDCVLTLAETQLR